jgi:hypothetical protein
VSAYPGCSFCWGRGCLACDGEEAKDRRREREAIQRSLANPLVIHRDDSEEMAILVRHFHKDVIDQAYAQSAIAGDLLMSVHHRDARRELAELHARRQQVGGDDAPT